MVYSTGKLTKTVEKFRSFEGRNEQMKENKHFEGHTVLD